MPLCSTINNERRSQSAIHIATFRDYERRKLAEKHKDKFERDFVGIEKKFFSSNKWNQRVENNKIRSSNVHRRLSSLEKFIERERSKQENIVNSKEIGNQRIRRSIDSSSKKN